MSTGGGGILDAPGLLNGGTVTFAAAGSETDGGIGTVIGIAPAVSTTIPKSVVEGISGADGRLVAGEAGVVTAASGARAATG